MDSVRFGRALGTGARLAAKTLVTAVDAASSPNPSPVSSTRSPTRSQTQPVPTPAPTAAAPSSPLPPTPPPAAYRAGGNAARNASKVRVTSRGIAQGSRRFGEAVWGPVVKLSGVLWLELTGVFFGVFALFAGIAAWKLRDHLHQTPPDIDAHTHLELAVAMAIVFGYFCVSSFLRAGRRGRSR